jgi:hypothetical protein
VVFEQAREGAISAVATTIESCRTMQCQDSIVQVTPTLCQFLAGCIQSYHGRNLLIALDATEQLAMCCSLSEQSSVRPLVSETIHHFSSHGDA